MITQATQMKNGTAIALSGIPILELQYWRDWILQSCGGAPPPVLPVPLEEPGAWPESTGSRAPAKGRLAALFGFPQGNNLRIFALVALEHKRELHLSSALLPIGESRYPSLTPDLPEAHWFERELAEMHRVVPENHPWLKPLRQIDGVPFYRLEGDSIHEVAVGPVHAGIIEPGHFRFQCFGEKVFHLEIQLGYQHRGIEAMLLKASPGRRLVLAESIAGDTVIGHALAYCQALEALSQIAPSKQSDRIRGIALELERLANHVGDLGALANDVGFLPAASYFGRLRAEFLNLLLRLSGNRYGRSLLVPGGVQFGLDAAKVTDFQKRLETASSDFVEIAGLLFSTASAMARFEDTGIVRPETAQGLGLVGPAARASHLNRDVRRDFPFGIYRTVSWKPVRCSTGDVRARAQIRYLECLKSLEFIQELLKASAGESHPLEINKLLPSALSISLVEGWRGEIVHVVMTEEEGRIAGYKVVDPSFHNWMGLAMALRNGQISDFPLCNKSFNLSYAGHDL
jgi:Ni,Fe-hydrogenase III large subunit